MTEDATEEKNTPEDAPEESASEDTTSSQDAYDELHNQYLRLAADFENFRKRQAQEREALLKYGAENTFHVLLPVLDNLELARQSLSEESDPKSLYQSFELMSQQLLDSLKQAGLEKISPQGETFDPEFHEAVSQVSTNEVPENTIAQVHKDGYRLHDRVLRAAQVIVATTPEDQPDAAATAGFNPDAEKNLENPFQTAGEDS